MSNEPSTTQPAPDFLAEDDSDGIAGNRGVETAKTRVRDQPEPAGAPAPRVERCLNCEAELHGRYCAHCGQNAQHHVLSLWHTLTEFLEDVSHADGRMWKTLRLLALKPGELTCEYLRGKRASYTAPFRLYIALSLLLFLVTSLPDGSKSEGTIEQSAQAVALTQEATEALNKGLENVAAERRSQVREQLLRAVAKVPAESQVHAITELARACGANTLGQAILNTGVASGLPPQEVLANCERLAEPADKFLSMTAEYAPKMMVFFLPLIAVFGKLLYLGSRRYYIGHLVFFVHFHAFVFLAMAFGNLVSRVSSQVNSGWLSTVSGLTVAVLVFWVPIYLYKAMRHVYGQGRLVTRIKFVMLSVCYFVSFFISFLLLAMFVALQVDWSGINWSGVDWSKPFNLRIG